MNELALIQLGSHAPQPVFRQACTNPAGNEADANYNGDYHVYQFCNGTNWQSYEGGSFQLVAGGGTGCTNPTAAEAAVIYNAAYHTYQFCNGTYWIPFGQLQTAPILPGYFVLSGGTYTGNLGGLSGADAKCLSDLMTNTGWMGYASAYGSGQLVSGNVHALLCNNTNSECPVLVPSTTYYFANANDGTAGGASFTTDAYSYGPGDSANWSGQTYFNTSVTYWGNDGVTGGITTHWVYTAANGCSGWSTSSGSVTGELGTSASTVASRWTNDGTIACNTPESIICFVNP
jgi:hypothetical protein